MPANFWCKVAEVDAHTSGGGPTAEQAASRQLTSGKQEDNKQEARGQLTSSLATS
ncbi:hypothetical protein PACTADRAFT_51448 [Pachysolen tannophilus NRRL Y-2460]|uniref:Uncharacterized protein n=1 Tax=Pachysolen tannophilus NRRL Y-2460 TaxID=669874 RepID=A0A1E4TPP2_PACTA|nr:hypothetical protein PACTADRAFT_51448 [Pachysolen tannophilus NRRL Y-2460]